MAKGDPIPTAHVALRIAFERFHGLDHEPLDNAELIGRFLRHLESGSLRAMVRDPKTGALFDIPPEAWKNAYFAWRPLFFGTILGNENSNDAFKPYAGRTPFVPEAQLAAIMPNVTLSELENRESQANASPRIGARTGYPWDVCENEFVEHVAVQGTPTVDGGERDWKRPADAERWVHDWMQKRLGVEGKHPGVRTVRRYVKKWLEIAHSKKRP
jgi:hypothetical protein